MFSLHKRIVKNLFQNFVSGEGDIFKAAKILKLEEIYKLNVSVTMYKVMKLGEVDSIGESLDIQYPMHQYETRSRNLLVLPFPRVETIRLNYKYQFTKIWNSVPGHITNLSSIGRFKKALFDYYLSLYPD